MGKRGPKRKHNQYAPKHINQQNLPDRCYWDKSGNGHWYIRFEDEIGKARRKRLAGPDATLSELHRLVEDFSGTDRNTFRYVAYKYFESADFQKVSKVTKSDYQYCFDVVAMFDTRLRKKLSDIPLSRWDTPSIQKFVDHLSDTPTKAKHVHGFIRLVFAWGKRRGYNKGNPAIGVSLPKERKLQRLPSQRAYDKLVEYAKVNGTFGQKTPGSCPHYIWAVMEIEYLCRLRGVEARTLTDANVVDNGLLVHRRKGSKANITEFNDRLSEVVQYLIGVRDQIWKDRKMPYPLSPESRPLIVNTLGDVLRKSAYQSSWGRFIRAAIDRGVIQESERFSLHDLKRKGITDTEGTQAEKMEASGHKDSRMMDVYDKSVARVKPTSE